MKSTSVPDITIQAHLNNPDWSDTRHLVREALTRLQVLPSWSENYSVDDTSEVWIKANGRTIYHRRSSKKLPTATELEKLIRKRSHISTGRQIKQTASVIFRFLAALFIAFFPKCPFCWAAYMSYMGVISIGSFTYRPWFIYVAISLLVTNLAMLLLTRQRHGWGPFLLSLTGVLIIVANRLFIELIPFVWTGAFFLLVGSLWNSLPRRMTASIAFYWNQWRSLFKKQNVSI